MQKFLLCAALCAFPGLATAQDFTGPSIGLQLSYGDVDTDGPDLDGDDILYGVRAYYDVEMGNGFIVGAGLQFDGADIDLDSDTLGDDIAEIDDVFRIGARGGVVAGTIYYYGTAGYADASTS
ncbi:MAG: outer membrane beta-barrel protein, partial [Pseudomonadota bacterium]